MSSLLYRIQEASHGKHLLYVLKNDMKLSLTAIKKAKWHGCILVNDQPSFVNRVVYQNDLICVEFPEESPAYLPKPCALPINIVYRDEFFLVVDKPAPLASQSTKNHADDTLENALYYLLGEPLDFIYRPVNRLDKGTSGLMVIAMSAYSQHCLQKLLHTDQFTRTYTAITEGIPRPQEGKIDLPIRKADSASVRRIVSNQGKPSVTHYQTISTANNRAMLHLQLETGRTHQIRVHLSAIGCPIVGDFLYGHESSELPGRFALHSSCIILKHPISGSLLTFESPVPLSFHALLSSQ